MRKKLFSKKSSIFQDIEIIDILFFVDFFSSFLISTDYMNCELYQNSVGIGKLQKLLSFSKDFSFLIDRCIFLLFL